MKKLSILILVNFTVVFIFGSYTNAFGEDKLNIAVMNFQGQNISSMDAIIICGFIRSELVNSKVFKIIDKANMDRILSEQGFQQTGCTDRECAVKMGKILNLQKMINGNVSKLLGFYYITADCIDIETGEIQFSRSVKFREEDMLKEKTENIAAMLIADLTGKPVPVKKPPVSAPEIIEEKGIIYGEASDWLKGLPEEMASLSVGPDMSDIEVFVNLPMSFLESFSYNKYLKSKRVLQTNLPLEPIKLNTMGIKKRYAIYFKIPKYVSRTRNDFFIITNVVLRPSASKHLDLFDAFEKQINTNKTIYQNFFLAGLAMITAGKLMENSWNVLEWENVGAQLLVLTGLSSILTVKIILPLGVPELSVSGQEKVLKRLRNIKERKTKKIDTEKKKQERVSEKRELSLKAGSKSLIFPGWGQFSNKQKAKGWVVGMSFLLSASIAVASPIIAADSWDKYLATTDPGEATLYHNQTMIFDKTTVYSALTTLAIWLYGTLDAIIVENKDNRKTVSIPNDMITVQVNNYFNDERIGLMYTKYIK